MTPYRTAVMALLLALGGSALADKPDVFRNETAGFQVVKPAGWTYATAAQNLENLKAIKLSDAEFQAAMQKYATAPLVVMTKFKEPYADVNPSFKVTLKPYGPMKGLSPVQLISLVIPQFQKAFRDFELVQPPVEVEVAGIKSSYARMNYTMDTQTGEKFSLTSELWIVPRGDYFFMLGAGTRRDERNAKRGEIAEILKTVRVEL
ncbi:MAG: hypothetical protein K0S46_2444 [Moraxellaceae bacterium]|nr:hypothetical protein [Moraxellaceae bacterium]